MTQTCLYGRGIYNNLMEPSEWCDYHQFYSEYFKRRDTHQPALTFNDDMNMFIYWLRTYNNFLGPSRNGAIPTNSTMNIFQVMDYALA